MTGDNEPSSGAAPNQDEGGPNYERSSIQFPYFDLGECLRLASKISENNGASDCSDDQIAAWVDMSPKSSGYRSRMSAARLFGLIEQGAQNGNRLSDLALKCLDQHHARAAKVEAFLKVPLFNRVYENWKGQQIPPAAALERALVGFGVAEKQKARARQVMDRSAEDANFYENGRDRLVKPGMKGTPPILYDNNHRDVDSNGSTGGSAGGNGGGGDNLPPGLDPILRGLIIRLPKSGAKWPKSERKLWLQILENSFDLVYRDGAPDSSNGADIDHSEII